MASAIAIPYHRSKTNLWRRIAMGEVAAMCFVIPYMQLQVRLDSYSPRRAAWTYAIMVGGVFFAMYREIHHEYKLKYWKHQQSIGR